MRNETRVRETEESRPERIPLNEQRKSMLDVPKKPGFVRRWVNDDSRYPGIRINNFLRAGWRVVEDSLSVGTEGVVNQNQSVGSGARKYVGGGVNAILMEIEERYYNEDQAAKAEALDKIEAQIRNGEGIEHKIGEIRFEDRYTKSK